MAGCLSSTAWAPRLSAYVERNRSLKSEAVRLLEEALVRGQFERGQIARITGLPDRSARRILADVIAAGLLGSDMTEGTRVAAVSRRGLGSFVSQIVS